MKPFLVIALAAASLSAAPATRTFTGVITDSMCPTGNHAAMKMGPTDAECTNACVMIHGAVYVLATGKDTYELSDQQTPATFAGQRVRVTGALDAKSKTIQVTSIVGMK